MPMLCGRSCEVMLLVVTRKGSTRISNTHYSSQLLGASDPCCGDKTLHSARRNTLEPGRTQATRAGWPPLVFGTCQANARQKTAPF
jgi:hypothetical protein